MRVRRRELYVFLVFNYSLTIGLVFELYPCYVKPFFFFLGRIMFRFIYQLNYMLGRTQEPIHSKGGGGYKSVKIVICKMYNVLRTIVKQIWIWGRFYGPKYVSLKVTTKFCLEDWIDKRKHNSLVLSRVLGLIFQRTITLIPFFPYTGVPSGFKLPSTKWVCDSN